jgi:hypothetical protein
LLLATFTLNPFRLSVTGSKNDNFIKTVSYYMSFVNKKCLTCGQKTYTV